jgi:hypothetical protein
MKSKNLFINLVIVGMTLGTTWAIRGQFGHEQGAAWAGAVGAICILLIARREDWYSKLFKATLAAAIGWGLGGMMSYGIVVGYGRGVDFVNVYYGLLMLFVIGGLYGFLGGGLFGLVLGDSQSNRIKWAKLLVGMVAGGLISYFFLIIQWEWFMTPPRSEVWAVCLGMALFFTWFVVHYKQQSALRVAVFAGLGGGFGFAFGNFLQVLGNLTEIQFNFWNVMEYSLGFFGGLGMAYGTFTSDWQKTVYTQKKSSNFFPIVLAVMFIPFIVWDQSFGQERIQDTYSKLIEGDLGSIPVFIQIIALILIIGQFIFVITRYYFAKKDMQIQYSRSEVKTFFITHFGIYALYSLLITGAIISTYRIEQYLYLLNYAIILFALPKLQSEFTLKSTSYQKWVKFFIMVLVIIAALALIAISTHGEMPGMHRRFEF